MWFIFGVKPCRRVSSLLRGKDVCGLNLHSWNVSTCYLLCGHLRAAEEKVNVMLLMSDALINRSYQYFKIHCERCCLNHSCMTNNMLDTLYLSYGIMMLSYISWKLNKQQQDNRQVHIFTLQVLCYWKVLCCTSVDSWSAIYGQRLLIQSLLWTQSLNHYKIGSNKTIWVKVTWVTISLTV